MLNLLEWALGERDGEPDPARCEGLVVSLYDVRRIPFRLTRAVTMLAPKLAGAGRLVVGDPFSRIIQRLLPLSRARTASWSTKASPLWSSPGNSSPATPWSTGIARRCVSRPQRPGQAAG